MVVGWTDPQGARPWLGAMLLAYYDPEGRLVYAGRVGAASIAQSLKACGGACSRSQHPRCRSRCRRRAIAASDRPSSLAMCIGYGPSSSPKSNI